MSANDRQRSWSKRSRVSVAISESSSPRIIPRSMGKLTARINHSGFVSIFLLIVYISVSTLSLRRTQSAESNKTTDIIFGNKVFSDLGVVVYITGTLTGDGVAYKNNTIAVTCYIDRRECLVSSIQQIGENQIGRLDMPGIYPITK